MADYEPMQYRVLKRFSDGDTYVLIGHFDLKAKARLAIDDDVGASPKPGVVYEIDEVNEILTQSQIDEFMRRRSVD